MCLCQLEIPARAHIPIRLREILDRLRLELATKLYHKNYKCFGTGCYREAQLGDRLILKTVQLCCLKRLRSSAYFLFCRSASPRTPSPVPTLDVFGGCSRPRKPRASVPDVEWKNR
jgi:hypothetical protein